MVAANGDASQVPATEAGRVARERPKDRCSGG